MEKDYFSIFFNFLDSLKLSPLSSQFLPNQEPIQSKTFIIHKAKIHDIIISESRFRIYLVGRSKCLWGDLFENFSLNIGDDVKIIYQLFKVNIYSQAKIISIIPLGG